jgi:hypothetical protein
MFFRVQMGKVELLKATPIEYIVAERQTLDSVPVMVRGISIVSSCGCG